MKRLLIICVGFMLCVALVGCSGNSHESEIRNSVDNYMTSLKEGNYTKALESTIGEELKENFGFGQIKELSQSMFEKDEVSDSVLKEVEEFASYIFQKSIVEYKIDNISESKDTATVEISGKCIDFEKMNVETGKVDTDALAKQYLNDNMSELGKISIEQGEDAVYQKIMEDIAPAIFDVMKKAIDSTPSRAFKMQMTVIHKDGKWLISSIDELV